MLTIDTAEVKINELEDIATETIQKEVERKNIGKKPPKTEHQ